MKCISDYYILKTILIIIFAAIIYRLENA